MLTTSVLKVSFGLLLWAFMNFIFHIEDELHHYRCFHCMKDLKISLHHFRNFSTNQFVEHLYSANQSLAKLEAIIWRIVFLHLEFMLQRETVRELFVHLGYFRNLRYFFNIKQAVPYWWIWKCTFQQDSTSQSQPYFEFQKSSLVSLHWKPDISYLDQAWLE